MADPEDRMQPDGVPPDGRPRREPPIIEGEAVEVSADGSPAGPRGSQSSGPVRFLASIRSLGPARKIMLVMAAGIPAVAIAGAAWVYLAEGGGEPPRMAASPAAVPPGNAPVTVIAATAQPSPPAAPDDGSSKAGDAKEKELEGRVAAVDAVLTTMNERITALERAVHDSVAAGRAAADRADKAIALLAEAKKNGDEQEAAQQLDRGALDDLAARIKSLESRQMTLRQVQERLDRLASAASAGAPDKAVRAAVVAGALRNAVERDRPFAAELAAARTIGLEEGALALLEPFAATGLPKRNDLFRDLSTLLPELRRVSAPPGQDFGYLDRLQASAVRMLNIRPVKDAPGDDPPAVLSRIELKMVHQDVDAIIAELDKLPPQAKDLAQPWRARAVARRDALEAARAVATMALAKLGEPVTSGSSPQ